jgi:hypothetical protein
MIFSAFPAFRVDGIGCFSYSQIATELHLAKKLPRTPDHAFRAVPLVIVNIRSLRYVARRAVGRFCLVF